MVLQCLENNRTDPLTEDVGGYMKVKTCGDRDIRGGPHSECWNLSELDSENMWYQHILIELLTVLLLLQSHIHFSSCSSIHSSESGGRSSWCS